MSLFQNAISSIQMGIEDYRNNDKRRLLSAIRNVHAGVLLLCKEKLRQLSPPDSDEVLLKQKIQPTNNKAGHLQFIGTGKKTVDQQQIEERFNSLGITIDWKRLKDISAIRNNVEHYYFTGAESQIREAMADACVVVRQLLADVLGVDPIKALGDDTWATLLDLKAVFDAERKRCRESFAKLNWACEAASEAAEKFRCPECESALVRQINSENADISAARLCCSACGAEFEGVPTLEDGLKRLYASDFYDAAKGEAEVPVDTCPECMNETYVMHENICAVCEFSLGDAECAVCSEPLTLSDYANDSSLCSYHAWTMSKDD